MEQKTKKETSRKRKIVALICSIALCMLLVSVSVYAAVSQTAKVTNTISVTRSGQSYVAVTVKKATSSASTAYTLAKGADVGTYNDLLTVDAGKSDDVTDSTQMVFSAKDGINAYAYEITLDNQSTDTAVTYSINLYKTGTQEAYTAPGTEVKIAAATGTDDLADYAPISGVTLAAGANTTVYVVVYTTVALGDMTPVTGTAFDLVISTQA